MSRLFTIWTDEHAFGLPAKDPALWQPTTRESADHSLPFCVAVALLDGKVDLDTFAGERFLDEDVLGLMRRMRIRFDRGFSAAAPEQRACRLVVEDCSGEIFELERVWLPGDLARVPGEKAVAGKFVGLASTYLSADQVQGIYQGIVGMSNSESCSLLVDLLVEMMRE